MHEVRSPSKNIFNQSGWYFSSLTNDYLRPANCWSVHSNMVARLWCLDDTHFSYKEAKNLFLVKISKSGNPLEIGWEILSLCSKGLGKCFQVNSNIVKVTIYLKFVLQFIQNKHILSSTIVLLEKGQDMIYSHAKRVTCPHITS